MTPHPTLSAGPTKSSKTPRCPLAMPWQQRKIEHPGDHSFVMLRVLRRKQPKQVSKQDSADADLNICIHTIHVTRVHSSKFLGVIIDDNLNWKPHIQLVKSKLSKTLSIFYKASKLINYDRLGQVSMKCKVVGIFGEKLVNIHFYIIWICWIQKSCLPSWILIFRSRVTKNKMATKIEVFFLKTLLLTYELWVT